MDSYQAQLQKLKAQRQGQLGNIQAETNAQIPSFQQDRNRTMLQQEQNKRRIRDLMSRFNTVGGGQQYQIESDNATDTSNAIAGIDTEKKNFEQNQAMKIQNTNANFDASESEALANWQEQQAQLAAQQRKSSQKDDLQKELNSVYVALNQSIDDASADQFLQNNRNELIFRYGQPEFDKMKAMVDGARPEMTKRYVGKNINTTPQDYTGFVG